MEQNKTRSYFLYAIGEILLVVIGILLALQINNWNEEKRILNQEQNSLQSLKQEVNSNLAVLEDCYDNFLERIQFAEKIRSHLSPDFQDISVDSLNLWLGETGSTARCIVSTDILDELQSSGNLKNIRNVVLRRQIGAWLTAVEKLSGEEKEWAGEFSRDYIPYANKWIAWDDVDYLFNDDDPSYFPSRFEVDPRLMLQEFEFSNIFAIHFWRIKRVSWRLETLKVETKVLEEQITANIKQNN